PSPRMGRVPDPLTSPFWGGKPPNTTMFEHILPYLEQPSGTTLVFPKPGEGPRPPVAPPEAPKPQGDSGDGPRASEAGVHTWHIAPDGKTVVLVSERKCQLWGIDGRRRASLELSSSKDFVGFSPDGKTLLTKEKDGLALWDVTSGERRAQVRGHTGPVRLVTYTPDGKSLVTVADDRSIKFWDPMTGQERLTLAVAREVLSLAFSPDGRTLAVYWRATLDESDLAEAVTLYRTLPDRDALEKRTPLPFERQDAK
ncbi:MAG TPA: hypothetical protein VKD72_11650, partial [Gemmataceae bacterium]|nr:hypothetical protein [Gemmataceae bacterium]